MKISIGIALFFLILGCTALANATFTSTPSDGGYIVTDSASGLSWYYVPTGSALTTGTFSQASSWASGLNASQPGGLTGWSLASIAQLQALYAAGGSSIAAFNFVDTSDHNTYNALTNAGVWASDSIPAYPTFPAGVFFSNGVALSEYGFTNLGELAVTSVPVPASLLLFAPGLGCLGFLRRRMKR
jgi:hypothetical protein